VKLLERASNVHRNVKDVARPVMLELQERFNETVNLSVLDDGGNVLYLDIAESSRPFRMTATVGCRMPAHITSMGKAMLAYMQIDDPASPGAPKIAGLPPKSARILYRELEVIRDQGYAIDREENEPGVGCIGGPIFDANGRPVAAMSISGPVHRILSRQNMVAEALLAACRAVSRKLGYEPAGAYGRGAMPRLARRATAR
jgi:IclR family acetate operon transcriptional repressor